MYNSINPRRRYIKFKTYILLSGRFAVCSLKFPNILAYSIYYFFIQSFQLSSLFIFLKSFEQIRKVLLLLCRSIALRKNILTYRKQFSIVFIKNFLSSYKKTVSYLKETVNKILNIGLCLCILLNKIGLSLSTHFTVRFYRYETRKLFFHFIAICNFTGCNNCCQSPKGKFCGPCSFSVIIVTYRIKKTRPKLKYPLN